jgi:hypothetical protein
VGKIFLDSLNYGSKTQNVSLRSLQVVEGLQGGILEVLGLHTIKKPQKVPDGCSIKKLKDPKVFAPSTFRVIGPANLSWLPASFDVNNPNNEYVSIVDRHMKISAPSAALKWLQLEGIGQFFVEIIQANLHLMTLGEWISGIDEPAKRKRYEVCLTNYSTKNGFVHDREPKFHKRNFFLKNEILMPSDCDLSLKRPRGIQGMCYPEVNACLGYFVKSVSKSLAWGYNNVDLEAPHRQWPRFSYTSGSTNDRVGAWFYDMRQAGYCFLEDDFSEYDSTQGKGAHDYELSIYNKLCPSDDAWYALMQQADTKGYSKFYKYEVPFTRKSGDQNTSVGNTLLNFSVHKYAMECCGITDYFMIGLGDDNVIAYKGQIDVLEIQATIESFGLKPKLKVTNDPSYCSSVFIPCWRRGKESFVLGPDPYRFISKFGFTVSKVMPNERLGVLKNNVISVNTCSFTPLMRVYERHYNSGSIAAIDNKNWVAHFSNELVTGRDVETWFCNKYEITVLQLEELERFLSSMLNTCDGACFFQHPLL